MAASQPLFDATIEPDEDPVRNTSSTQFPAGNIGSSGSSRSQNQPVTLTPGPAATGIASTSGNAEMGIVSGCASFMDDNDLLTCNSLCTRSQEF